MDKKNYASSRLKNHVRETLLSQEFSIDCAFEGHAPRLVLAALFSMYFDPDQILRWRAITATGSVMSKMANENMESARIVMRRLMWTLNDESGGIGWGSPEAMGEIMARHARLSDEYHRILVSYMMEDGNYLELEVLQRGVIWAVARLAEARPDIGEKVRGLVRPYLFSPDREVRGQAARLAGIVHDKESIDGLGKMISDDSSIPVYENSEIKYFKISEIAKKSIGLITAS